MVKVKCILGYYDTQKNKRVRIGDEFDVTEERAKRLIKAKVVEIIPPTAPEKVAKARKKKED